MSAPLREPHVLSIIAGFSDHDWHMVREVVRAGNRHRGVAVALTTLGTLRTCFTGDRLAAAARAADRLRKVGVLPDVATVSPAGSRRDPLDRHYFDLPAAIRDPASIREGVSTRVWD